MATVDGILTKLCGSAGQLTFKRVKGRTIVSEKATQTTNPRTTAQQKHRMKWPNLIKMYSGIAPLLNNAFEGKTGLSTDYNLFVKVNFTGSKVYLTKNEVRANSCVAAPYQITMGSLPSIEWTGEAGSSVTNIQLGELSITAETSVKEFSNAVVSHNFHFDYGDQIAFIKVDQSVNPITGYPQCSFTGESIVLDKGSETKLLSLVSAAGFSVSEGKLSCQLAEDFQGAYAWVHSRKENGKTLVSTQMLTVKNELYATYSTEAAYRRAVATYGGENSNFLTPEVITQRRLTLVADPAEGGTVSGAGLYEEGETATIAAVANSGYLFTGWSDGISEANRNLTLTEDLTLTAHFEAEEDSEIF